MLGVLLLRVQLPVSSLRAAPPLHRTQEVHVDYHNIRTRSAPATQYYSTIILGVERRVVLLELLQTPFVAICGGAADKTVEPAALHTVRVFSLLQHAGTISILVSGLSLLQPAAAVRICHCRR